MSIIIHLDCSFINDFMQFFQVRRPIIYYHQLFHIDPSRKIPSKSTYIKINLKFIHFTTKPDKYVCTSKRVNDELLYTIKCIFPVADDARDHLIT